MVGFDQMVFWGIPNEITASASTEKIPAKLLFGIQTKQC